MSFWFPVYFYCFVIVYIYLPQKYMYKTNFFSFQSLFLKLDWPWKLNHPPQMNITEILSPIPSLRWSSDTPYHFPHLWDKTLKCDPPQLHGKETWGQPSSDPRDIQWNPSIKNHIAEKINNTWMIISQQCFLWKILNKRGTCEGMEPENIKWRVSHMYSQGVGVEWGGGEQWQRDWLPINTWFIEFW